MHDLRQTDEVEVTTDFWLQETDNVQLVTETMLKRNTAKFSISSS